MMKIPNEHRDYFFFGLKRSGNHAVINWLLNHFESYIHYNNCFVIGEHIYVDGPHEITKKGCRHSDFKISILSFEDRPVLLNEKFNSSFSHVLKLKPKINNILLLRDAYNTYASRYQKKLNPTMEMNWWNEIWTNYNDKELWISYAKEYLEPSFFNKEVIKINFNDWFLKKEYREEISAKFEVEHSDAGLEFLATNGGGSSFDQMDYQNRSQQMEVTKRYRQLTTNEDFFKTIICDEQLKFYNEKIFNFHPNFNIRFL